MNEKFSAFLDNEATRDEIDAVVGELLRDESLRESWTRQHWVRTTLRSSDTELAAPVDVDFSKRVMNAISVGEQAESSGSTGRSDRVISIHKARSHRRWRGVAGLAAAASVAGIVVLAGGPFLSSGNGARNHVATAGQQAARGQGTGTAASTPDHALTGTLRGQLADFSYIPESGPSVRTVAMNTPARHATTNQWSVSDPAVRNELNGYLADHNGMARGYGMYMTTPALVRMAAYRQGVTQ